MPNTENTQTAPEFMVNAQGHLVPMANVREIDKLRDSLVREKIEKALVLHAELKKFKQEIMQDMSAFVELSLERYSVKHGGKKGNVTLATYDGKYQLQRQIAEYVTFDEGLQAAKALIDECLKRWTEGSSSEIQALVNYSFEVDKKGCINTNRILALRKVQITDERWQLAMQAIGDSLQIVGSKSYVRLYERDDDGKMLAISLNISDI